MLKKRNVHGEGNYEASRKYNEGLRNFIRSGRVGRAARDAEPASDVDALQMAAAETEGKRRAKEEDPALRGAMPKPPVPAKLAGGQERDAEDERYAALMLGGDAFD